MTEQTFLLFFWIMAISGIKLLGSSSSFSGYGVSQQLPNQTCSSHSYSCCTKLNIEYIVIIFYSTCPPIHFHIAVQIFSAWSNLVLKSCSSMVIIAHRGGLFQQTSTAPDGVIFTQPISFVFTPISRSYPTNLSQVTKTSALMGLLLLKLTLMTATP